MERTSNEDVSSINDFVKQCSAQGSNIFSRKKKVHKEDNNCPSNDSNQQSQGHPAAFKHKTVTSRQILQSKDLSSNDAIWEGTKAL